MKTGQKNRKSKMSPKKLIRRPDVSFLRTKSGFRVKIHTLEPMIFQELRDKYNIDRKRFVIVYHSEETGADIEFDYKPPDVPPDKEEDLEAWEHYHMFLQWNRDFQHDYNSYRKDANNLMLIKAVEIVDYKKGDWKKYYNSNEWSDKLQAGGVKIAESNRYILFLKAEVLTEQEYLITLNEATAEEVTFGDVLRALDYFRSVLRRHQALSSSLKSGGDGETKLFNELLGISNDGPDSTEDLVEAAENGESSKGGS